MSNSINRSLFALMASTGGLLAVLSLSSAIAGADDSIVDSVSPSTIAAASDPGAAGFGLVPPADVTTYTIVPQSQESGFVVTSITGLAPLYTTVEDHGIFLVNGDSGVGNASFSTDIFGDSNVLYQQFADQAGDTYRVIDELKLSSGVENIYTEMVGTGANGANSINDILVTPFGDFNIPTTFDAAAVIDFSNAAPAAATDWTSALDADWTTLVTDFSALF